MIHDNIRESHGLHFRRSHSHHRPVPDTRFDEVAAVAFPGSDRFSELIIDPACTVVFEAERAEANVMERPPRDPPATIIFGWRSLSFSVLQGLSVLVIVLAFYSYFYYSGYGREKSGH